MSNHPPRGIIVTDATELVTYSVSYDAQHVVAHSPITALSHPTGSYLDILLALSERYPIIVPEMVILESTGMLGDGTNLGCIFGNLDLYPTRSNVQSFCRTAIAGRYPTEVIQAEESRDYGAYIASLRSACDEVIGPEHKIPVNTIRSARVSAIQRQHKHKKAGFGEEHCIDVIEAELRCPRKQGESIPIFFLSADSKARERLRDRVPEADRYRVRVLTANGILSALEQDVNSETGTSALYELGLSGTANMHWQHIKESDNILRPDLCSDNGYQDAPLPPYGTEQFPFAESVRGLTAELVPERLRLAAEAKAALDEGAEARRGKWARYSVQPSTQNGGTKRS